MIPVSAYLLIKGNSISMAMPDGMKPCMISHRSNIATRQLLADDHGNPSIQPEPCGLWSLKLLQLSGWAVDVDQQHDLPYFGIICQARVCFNPDLRGLPNMRILTTIVLFSLTALLCACDQRHAASGVDPGLGLECFESHRAALPPGSQYEGIEKLAGSRLTIRVMNGVEVVTLACELNPDGTLRSAVE